MQSNCTSEQILSLAVDKHALRTTRAWAAREKWLALGQDQDAILGHIAWGHFNAKSKRPIQTMVSLTTPRFVCTCASRKLPCSHALGLRLLHFDTPHLFTPSAPPDSDDWHASLSDAASISPSPVEATSQQSLTTQTSAPRSAQQEEADDARLQRIRAGLAELDLWLGDLIRNGLDGMRNKKRTVDWQRMARRLVDAQASELAVSVRKMATIPGSTPQWPEELLTQMGRLHLLCQGFQNFEALSPEVQGDLRVAVGWLPKVDPTSPTVLVDRWHVLAREQESVGKQRRHKIWLWGEESNRAALIVHILHNKQNQIEDLIPGTLLSGPLYFYPSMAPLRAELLSNMTAQQPAAPALGHATLAEAFDAITQISAQNPWQSHFPILIRSASVRAVEGQPAKSHSAKKAKLTLGQPALQPRPQWRLYDESGIQLPLPEKFDYGWHLQALDGGTANQDAANQDTPEQSRSAQTAPEQNLLAQRSGVHLFGIWDRKVFTPLTVWQSGRWLSLHILKGEV